MNTNANSRILIKLDPSPDAWGSDCEEAIAKRANELLKANLEAEGFTVEIHTLATSQIICANPSDVLTAEEHDLARAAIERLFNKCLDQALVDQVVGLTPFWHRQEYPAEVKTALNNLDREMQSMGAKRADGPFSASWSDADPSDLLKAETWKFEISNTL